MSAVVVAGKTLRLDPAQAIGKGGEADIYDIGGGLALKLFKPPEHPDYQGQPEAQQAARERLAQHQHKLRQFPSGLPDRVVRPIEAASDRHGKLVGYTMRLVPGATPLARYADRAYRQTGIDSATVTAIFLDLHASIAGIHRAGVVIGDCNDLNVLVTGTAAHLIDADSFAFGPYCCGVFTQRFVDPLLCVAQGSGLTLTRPHNPASDWYAFAVLLMQSLLYVDPYGGIYRSKTPSVAVPPLQRPLHRLTVFHPDVRYPKPALPTAILPDDLLEHLRAVFERDRRDIFPLALLQALTWRTCPSCGLEHARTTCPRCRLVVPIPPVPLVRRGTVTASVVFTTTGRILYATVQEGAPRWLYHQDGAYYREDSAIVARGPLNPRLTARLQGATTLLGRDGLVEVHVPGRPVERLSIETASDLPGFDATERHRYWAHQGMLWRDGTLGAEPIGAILAGQTRFWAGPAFGFGLYHAGALRVAFIFDAERRGLNDSVALPPLPGTIIDAACVLSATHCYLIVATRERGHTIHRCFAILRDGTVAAHAEAKAGDAGWLGAPWGACAVGNFLLVPTDEGIVRVEAHGTALLESRRFPDTEPFVDAASRLLPGSGGLYVVGEREIRFLRIA